MTVRVGFIGAGGIANAHLQVLRHMEGVRIAAFCDVDRERAESHAAAYNGRAYTDVHAMLDAEKLEAVYICVPPHAHVGQEEALIERGIPFFVEKPIANTLEKAESIAAAVEKAGLLTSVGYHWRYMTYSQLARERLAGKTIGMALGYWMGGMPGVYWWRRQDLSGGQMVEQTTHIIDLARDLCGEIVEVYAAMSTRASGDIENCTVTDVGTMTVKFASGAVGAISAQGVWLHRRLACGDAGDGCGGGRRAVSRPSGGTRGDHQRREQPLRRRGPYLYSGGSDRRQQRDPLALSGCGAHAGGLSGGKPLRRDGRAGEAVALSADGRVRPGFA
jgi:predicted dehydrogenase